MLLQNLIAPPLKTRVVPTAPPHRYKRGDETVKDETVKYDESFKLGNTTIHVVYPSQMTQEEIDQVLKDYHTAGWAIIDELLEKGQLECAATNG